mgnify:FL=1|tara:strand:- start:1030 stop:1653 length:624 start_codon:yes stop_codon:yes gene_type:complete
MNYSTDQEDFWAGKFGDDYIGRNKGEELLASNLNFFSKGLKQIRKIKSCIEFGSNIGMNLKAIKLLYPNLVLKGVEINKAACKDLSKLIGAENVYNKSIFDLDIDQKFDLSFIKGVLIHINPEKLQQVYQKLYDYSNRYILIAEYYNPKPVSITYRGHENRLFKRDFAGEFLDKFRDVSLVDYGFSYRRDPSFPQDDITWFLIQKKN